MPPFPYMWVLWGYTPEIKIIRKCSLSTRIFTEIRYHCGLNPQRLLHHQISNLLRTKIMIKAKNATRNPVPLKVHHVHYLRIGTKTSHRPCIDGKGIHCTGDKFNYVVDWHINSGKKETLVEENYFWTPGVVLRKFVGADNTFK